MFADLPLADLRSYAPEVAEPADFDAFWASELSAARARPLDPRFTKVDTAIRHAEVFDVTFAGYGGDPIKGWYLRAARGGHTRRRGGGVHRLRRRPG